MKTNLFRILRMSAAAAVFALLAVLFVDWGGDTSMSPLRSIASPLARLQVVPAVMAVSVVPLVALAALTLLFGRIYCSVLCPLGVLQDGVNVAAKVASKRAAMRFSYRKPCRWMRYGVLALTVILIAAGVGAAVALVDPYGIFGRIIYDGLRPLAQGCNNFLAAVAGDSFARETVSVSWVSAAIALIMLVIVVISAWRGGRAYCNSFCPVGTLLGEVSRASLLRMRIDTDRCVSCGVCSRKCKGSCIDPKSHTIDVTRCVVCFDCLDACPHGAISYTPVSGAAAGNGAAAAEDVSDVSEKPSEAVDESRRRFLTAVAVAAASLPEVKAQALQNSFATVARVKRPYERRHPVAPAGSVSLEHLHAKCTSCHLCVSKCPGHVLQPAVMEYGLEGVMHPVMRFDKGYCLYECTLCGEVCPTGAILPLNKEQKKETFIGHAVFRRGLCVVHTDGVECGNCADHCPAEAIRMVPSADGRLYPEVERALCIGCGRCEYVCPASPVSAIHVEGYAVHDDLDSGGGERGHGQGRGQGHGQGQGRGYGRGQGRRRGSGEA